MSENKKKRQTEPDARNDQIEDYKLSRAIYVKLINSGMSGLEALEALAKESEHPRAFEILGTYIKNIGDLNDKLIDTQRKMQVIRQEENIDANAQLEVDPKKQITFQGSTSDLRKQLAQLMDEPADDILDAEFEEIKDDVTESKSDTE